MHLGYHLPLEPVRQEACQAVVHRVDRRAGFGDLWSELPNLRIHLAKIGLQLRDSFRERLYLRTNRFLDLVMGATQPDNSAAAPSEAQLNTTRRALL
jgi:hypothetical protein